MRRAFTGTVHARRLLSAELHLISTLNDKLANPSSLTRRVAQYALMFTACFTPRSPDMTIRFISRHPGVVAWAREEGIEVTHVIAEDCSRYLDLSPEPCGSELSSEGPRRCGAPVEEFVIQPITRKPLDESIG